MTGAAVTRRTAIASAAAVGVGFAARAAADASVGSDHRNIVMIIRHGEKPVGGGQPYGITTAGTEDSDALTTDGWARAGALATLFDPSVGPVRAGLARPGVVYAAKPTAGGSNLRESETVGPLAAKLGVELRLPFEVGAEASLAAELRATRGPVLVCWEHKHIPSIATHLGSVSPAVPSSWPGDRFDVVYVFTRRDDGRYSFRQVPQLLLAGDSRRPIS